MEFSKLLTNKSNKQNLVLNNIKNTNSKSIKFMHDLTEFINEEIIKPELSCGIGFYSNNVNNKKYILDYFYMPKLVNFKISNSTVDPEIFKLTFTFLAKKYRGNIYTLENRVELITGNEFMNNSTTDKNVSKSIKIFNKNDPNHECIIHVYNIQILKTSKISINDISD